MVPVLRRGRWPATIWRVARSDGGGGVRGDGGGGACGDGSGDGASAAVWQMASDCMGE